MPKCKDCAFIGTKRYNNVFPCLVLNRITSPNAPACEHFEKPWTDIISRIRRVGKIRRIALELKKMDERQMEASHG